MEEKYLSELYNNPESPASFGGVDSIYHALKTIPSIRYRGIRYVRGYKNRTRILYINL